MSSTIFNNGSKIISNTTQQLLKHGKPNVKPVNCGKIAVKNMDGVLISRNLVTKSTGAFLPQPAKEPFGLIGIGGTVAIGLTLGATISKHIASFLEENDLFVPADDDDDD